MSHPGRLEGKVALVTGGGLGIGQAIVEKFVHEGAKCLVVDVNDENGQNVADAQPKDTAVFCHGDVRKEEDWEAIISKVIQVFGKLDIVINNAGIVTKMQDEQPSIEVEEEKFDRIIDTNLKSLYHSARAWGPVFKKQGHGAVVNLSSVSQSRPRPYLVWYAASKGGVSAVTKGLAAEFAPSGVRVNAVLPVATDTDMAKSLTLTEYSEESRAIITAGIPLGRWGQPRDVANAVCFLASDEAEFITGVLLKVDGGRALN